MGVLPDPSTNVALGYVPHPRAKQRLDHFKRYWSPIWPPPTHLSLWCVGGRVRVTFTSGVGFHHIGAQQIANWQNVQKKSQSRICDDQLGYNPLVQFMYSERKRHNQKCPSFDTCYCCFCCCRQREGILCVSRIVGMYVVWILCGRWETIIYIEYKSTSKLSAPTLYALACTREWKRWPDTCTFPCPLSICTYGWKKRLLSYVMRKLVTNLAPQMTTDDGKSGRK